MTSQSSLGDRFCPPYYNWLPSVFRAMRRLCSSLVFSVSDSDCVLVSTCSPENKKKYLELFKIRPRLKERNKKIIETNRKEVEKIEVQKGKEA